MMFVIIIHPPLGGINFEVRGPYRSFKKAESDAKAWDGIDGRQTTVNIVESQKVKSIDQPKQLK